MERGTLVPLPEAELWWTLATKLEDQGLRALLVEERLSDPKLLIREMGEKLIADATGMVELPEPGTGDVGSNFLIAAKTPTHSGWESVTLPPGGEFRLLLAPPKPIEVVVRDRHGAPAGGVPVGIQRSTTVITRAQTDPQGRAGLYDVDPTEARMPRRVAVLMPGLADVSKALQSGVAEHEPVEVTLPATGEVEVLVPSELRSRVGKRALVTLSTVGSKTPSLPPWKEPIPVQLLEGESVVFRHVGLGLALQATLLGVNATEVPVVIDTGPKREGERVTFAFPAERASCVLRGRLLSKDGTPASRVTFAARFELPEGKRSGRLNTPLTTDDGGRFEFEVPADIHAKQPGIVALDWAQIFPRPKSLGTAYADLPRPLTLTSIDLGDLRILLPEVLVKGRVVDEQGRGVSASVDLCSDSRGRGGALDSGSRENLLGTRTDAEGQFEFIGALRQDSFWIRTRASDRSWPPLRKVNRGDLEVTILAPSDGQIEIRVLLDPGAELHHFEFELVPQTPHQELLERIQAPDPVAVGENIIRFERVPPGDWGLVVSPANGLPTPLAAFAGLKVVGTETLVDPRLNPLDLRNTIKTFLMTVRDDRGHPIEGARFGSEFPTDATGRSRIPAMSNEGIGVEAEGFMREYLTSVNRDMEITLVRGRAYEVQIDIQGGFVALVDDVANLAATEGGLSVHLYLAAVPIDQVGTVNPEQRRGRAFEFRSSGVLPLTAEPGKTYTIGAVLAVFKNDASSHVPLTWPDSPRLTLPAEPPEKPILLRLSRDAVFSAAREAITGLVERK